MCLFDGCCHRIIINVSISIAFSCSSSPDMIKIQFLNMYLLAPNPFSIIFSDNTIVTRYSENKSQPVSHWQCQLSIKRENKLIEESVARNNMKSHSQLCSMIPCQPVTISPIKLNPFRVLSTFCHGNYFLNHPRLLTTPTTLPYILHLSRETDQISISSVHEIITDPLNPRQGFVSPHPWTWLLLLWVKITLPLAEQ